MHVESCLEAECPVKRCFPGGEPSSDPDNWVTEFMMNFNKLCTPVLPSDSSEESGAGSDAGSVTAEASQD